MSSSPAIVLAGPTVLSAVGVPQPPAALSPPAVCAWASTIRPKICLPDSSCGLAQRGRCERVLDAIVHVSAQRCSRGHGIALQSAVEQRPVLCGGLAAAITERHHLVAKIFV